MLNRLSVRHLPGVAVVNFFFLLFSAVTVAVADDEANLRVNLGPIEVTATGSHRTRYEVLDNTEPFSRTTTNAVPFSRSSFEDLVSLRTNLLVEASFKNFTIGGELMDSRAYSPFGANPNLIAPISNFMPTNELRNAVEPVQLYVKARFDDILADGSEIEITGGRFTMDLGSGRLIGRREFRNTVESFLGGKIKWTAADRTIDLYYARPFSIRNSDGSFFRSSSDNNIEFDSLSTRTHLWGARYEHRRLFDDVNAEIYFHGARQNFFESGAPVTYMLTPGFRFWRASKQGAFDFEVEGAPQFLTRGQGIAYFAHAEAGYTFDHSWAPRVAILFDIASGQGFDPTPVGTVTPDQRVILRVPLTGSRAFNPLFGRLRDDFGPTGINRVFERHNIISPGVRASIAPAKNLTAEIAYRAAWREEPTLPGASEILAAIFDSVPLWLNSDLGHQVDARIRYSLLDETIEFELGGALFVFSPEKLDDIASGPFVEILRADETRLQPYGYASVKFNF